jgi:hypothetical protein
MKGVDTIARIRREFFVRGKTIKEIVRELHVSRNTRKPGALRNGAPFKNWVLPAGLERVRRKLIGAADGDRQFVDVLTAVLSDGLPAVEAACQEALGQGVHSADVILNILAQRREPAAPITIATPDALRLRHAPAADCARYDRLRRPRDGTFADPGDHERAEAVRHEGRL